VSKLYLLGPDGKPVNPPTLFDLVQDDHMRRLLPVMEALTRRVSPILDSKGRPYLRVVK